jgi:hypothetical protein
LAPLEVVAAEINVVVDRYIQQWYAPNLMV